MTISKALNEMCDEVKGFLTKFEEKVQGIVEIKSEESGKKKNLILQLIYQAITCSAIKMILFKRERIHFFFRYNNSNGEKIEVLIVDEDYIIHYNSFNPTDEKDIEYALHLVDVFLSSNSHVAMGLYPEEFYLEKHYGENLSDDENTTNEVLFNFKSDTRH